MSFFKKLFGFGKKSEKKTAAVHSHTSPKNGNLMLALEERYLYDAAGIASAFVGLATKPHTDAVDHHVDSDHSAAAEKSLADVFKDAVPPAAHVQKASEIVFIDPSVTDYQKIIESIPAKDRVIILDPNKDGVQQISEALAQQTDVKAIHIVSHGSDASLTLGNTQLSKDTIEKYSPMLTGWKDSLQQGADILIYGCNVAKDADGKAFTDRISQLTGADTAASDNETGAADKGGDWVLEYQSKNSWIDTKALSPKDYKYLLPTLTVSSTADTGAGSLRNTIASAANGDIINITATGTISLLSELTINKSLTITGPGASNLTINGAANAQVFNISSSFTLQYSDFKVGYVVTSSSDAALTVDTNGDTINDSDTDPSTTTLREAITYSNKNAGVADTIKFATGMASQQITLTSNLPTLTDVVDIQLNQSGLIIDGAGKTIDGGGVSRIFNVTASPVTIRNLTITKGYAAGGAGIRSTGTLTIEGCTIDGNNSNTGSDGGGIRVVSGTTTIRNSTFSNNYSPDGGGAIRVDPNATANIYSSTIKGNTAITAGGGIFNGINSTAPYAKGTVNIYSSIISGNTNGDLSGGTANAGANKADIDVVDHSLYGTLSTVSISSSLSNQTGTPDFGTFDYHGGTTKVWALQNTVNNQNIVINKGSSGLTTDQRGYTRSINGGVDIGAYELDASPTFTSNPSDLSPIAPSDVSNPPGDTISSLIASVVSDTDMPVQSKGIALTGITGTGTWEYFSGSWQPISSPAANSALLLKDTTKIRFVPSNDSHQTATVTFRAWDQAFGNEGDIIDVTSNDGTKTFSVNPKTANVAVLNVAPSISTPATNMSLTSIDEDISDSSNPGDTVLSIAGSRISDSNTNDPKGIAIISIDNAHGTWQYYDTMSTSWISIPALSSNDAFLLNASNKIRFVPDADYNGTSTIQFRAWDQTSGTAENTITISSHGGDTPFSDEIGTAEITVNPIADTPSLSPSSFTINEKDTTSDITITRNSEDHAEVQWVKISSITNGTLETSSGVPINDGDFISIASGSVNVKFTSSSSSDGSFDVKASVGNNAAATDAVNGCSAAVSETIDVISASGATTVTPSTSTTNEDTMSSPIQIATTYVGANSFKITDISNGTLYKNNGTEILKGTFISLAEGSLGLKFVPTLNYYNNITPITIFNVRASTTGDDTGLEPNTAIAKILVNPVNDTPTARDDGFSVLKNSSGVVLNVIGNDYDPDNGDVLTPTLVSGPSHGMLTYNSSSRTYTYKPATDYTGDDSFTYYVKDIANAQSGTATVSISVDDSVAANPDSFSTNENTTLTIKYSDLTSNDVNPKNFPLTYYIKPLQSPVHGTLTNDPMNKSVYYQPYTNVSDVTDSFQYTIVASNGSISTSTVTVTVNPKADPPNLAVPANLTFTEDQALSLSSIAASLTDPSGESLSVKISGMPSGAALSQGVKNSDGSWTLASEQLATVKLTPPSNYSGSFTLTVDAIATETVNGDTAATTKNIACTVTPVADPPIWNISHNLYIGDNNQPIPLPIELPQLTDTDGSEHLTDITISDVPSWVSFNVGTNNGDGTWTITQSQLSGGLVLIPSGGEGSMFLNLRVGSVEQADNSIAYKDQFLDITSQPEAPKLEVSDVSGNEDTGIPLSITASLNNEALVLTDVSIIGLPDNATLSNTLKLQDGTWLVANEHLANLTLTPPANSGDDIHLTARVSSMDEDGNTVTVEKTFTVDVVPKADMPNLTVYSPIYGADTAPVPLIITSSLTDTDGSETLSVKISDVPSGVTLSAGQNLGSGVWLLQPSELSGLTLTAPTGSPTFTLTVRAYATETENSDAVYAEKPLDVVFGPVAENDLIETDVNKASAPFNPLDNDKGYQITLLSYDTPAHGILSKNDEGKLIYTPATDYKGTDSFTYKIADNINRQATGTVNIKVGVVETAPVANADSYDTTKNTAITINAASGVLNNDTDAEHDTLTAIKVSDPANGTLTFNADGSFTYTPKAGFVGTDTFTYKANDGTLDSVNAATVTITVQDVALDAVDDSVTVAKNGSVTINTVTLFENDTRPIGTSLTSMTQPAHGILADNGDGTYEYKPATDYVGSDSFTYTLSDGKGNTDSATVSITVTDGHRPVAVDDSGYSVNTGNTLTVTAVQGVLANDTDADGDTLTAVKVSDPAHGTLTLNTDGSFVYTPNAGFTGTDTFTYKANDGKADSLSAATVTITVNPLVVVTANDDVYTTAKNTNILLEPFKNDVPSTVLMFDTISPNPNGRLVDNMDGTFWYIPTTDFVGQDVFTYTISDGNGHISNSAKITITVTDINTAPVANADSYSTTKNTAITVNAASGVLVNDTDVNGDTLTAIKASDPSNGTLIFNSDGSFTYTPNTGFVGTDIFTYKANDGKTDSLNPATVTISVGGQRPPVAVNDSASTNQNTAVTISFSSLMANDSDPDGDPLTVSPDYTSPAHGNIEKTADSFIYTPNTGYYGSDSFTYTISDGNGGTASATVNITVNQIGNRNPVAADDHISTTRETPITISYDFMKQNDSDPDGDPLTIPPGYSVPANGQITVNSNGFVYTPKTGFVGTDSFIYSLSDGKGGFSQARVYVTVNEAPNKLPNAGNDTVITEYNTPLTIGFATLLSNDTDADGDTLTVSPDFTMPAHGSLVRNGDNFVYTPTAGYTGTDSFTYIVSDGKGGTDSATVTITVKAPYQPPVDPGNGGYDYGGGGGYVPTTPTTPVVAIDDTLSVSKNTILSFKGTDILANDKTDGSRDILTITSFTQPSYGTLVKKADGTFTYVPSQNFTGSDSFTYTVFDGQSSSTAKVGISVLESAGIIAKDDALAVKGTTIIKADTLLANDIAINTYDRLTISGFSQPSHGILVDNGNNTFTYIPHSGYTGTDSFGYTITDGRGNKASATVRLNVGVSDGTDTPLPDDGDDDDDGGDTGVNHPPVVTDDHLNATQDTPMTFTAAQILANDTDADHDVLTVSDIEQPYDGKLTDNGNGTYTYTPNSGFTGEDSLAYTISDGKGGSVTGVVYINVSSKDITPPTQDNHAPVGVDDTLSTRVNTQLSIVKDTLVRNDGDADGDTLSVSAFTQPVYGTISDKGDGTLTYSPLNSFTGQDSFTYTVSDGKGGTSSAKVTVYVNSYGSEQKIFPDAIDDEVSTSQNVPITVTGQTMLANDKEPQGNPLTIIGYTQAYNGSVVKDSSGNYVYTPNTGFTGRDIFSYTISNGKGGTDTAWVRITIGSSATRSADSARRSADRAETSDTQGSNNSAADGSRPLPAPEPIVVSVDNSVTVTPIVVSESEEQSLTLPQDGTPYQKESYVSVSGQTVFDVKADKNYQEWIRTAVYDRNDILAANYGGGDSAEIIRYQAYFKARENDNPNLWKDQNTAANADIIAGSDTVDKRIVASNEKDVSEIGTSERVQPGRYSDIISPLDIIESLSQQADTNMLSFSEQIQLASGGFEGERTDFLSRLGALL